MNPQIGQTINMPGGIASGTAPGGSQYKTGAGATKILEAKTIGGQTYYNIDQSAIGGGTGWVAASAIGGASPVQPSQPQQQQQSSSPSSGGGGGWQSLPGYAGWDPVAAEADYKATGGAGKGGGTSGFSMPSAPQAPNFQNIYDTYLTQATNTYQPQVTAAQAEADTIQKEIDTRTAALNTALAKINDNPYYSEATRVGRAAKLQEAYNNDVKAISGRLAIAQNKVVNAQNQIEKAKADAQVRVNIASNQYNIQNQQYQQQLQQVNQYLSAGMFNNASGADIAQIATTTGMSTSMVQSIIDASKKSQEVKPTLSTIDDGTNQYVVAFDANGNVINKQVISSSKPSSTGSTAGSAKVTDKTVADAIAVLQKADVMNNENDTGDKLLADWEIQWAYEQILAQVVNADVAKQLLLEAINRGGYSEWQG